MSYWSENDLILLRDKYPVSSSSELMSLLPDKTVKAIRSKAKVLNLRKSKKQFRFTDEHVNELIELYPTTLSCDIAEKLGCSIYSVHHKAHKLNLKKDQNFLKEHFRKKLLDPAHPARKFCHQKGYVPPNKGKKQIEYMSPQAIERTKATRFKKGTKPPNWRPVGSTRINADCYIEIKVAEGMFQWRLLHRIIWEKHNGTIPERYNVQFKDHNRQNVKVENLYLIDKSGQMKDNTIQRYPTEVKRAIRLSSRLKKIIESYEKAN